MAPRATRTWNRTSLAHRLACLTAAKYVEFAADVAIRYARCLMVRRRDSVANDPAFEAYACRRGVVERPVCAHVLMQRLEFVIVAPPSRA